MTDVDILIWLCYSLAGVILCLVIVLLKVVWLHVLIRPYAKHIQVDDRGCTDRDCHCGRNWALSAMFTFFLHPREGTFLESEDHREQQDQKVLEDNETEARFESFLHRRNGQ